MTLLGSGPNFATPQSAWVPPLTSGGYPLTTLTGTPSEYAHLRVFIGPMPSFQVRDTVIVNLDDGGLSGDDLAYGFVTAMTVTMLVRAPLGPVIPVVRHTTLNVGADAPYTADWLPEVGTDWQVVSGPLGSLMPAWTVTVDSLRNSLVIGPRYATLPTPGQDGVLTVDDDGALDPVPDYGYLDVAGVAVDVTYEVHAPGSGVGDYLPLRHRQTQPPDFRARQSGNL